MAAPPAVFARFTPRVLTGLALVDALRLSWCRSPRHRELPKTQGALVDVAELVSTEAAFTAVAWSRDGAVLAIGGDDGVIRLWRPADDQWVALPGHRGPIRHLCWGPADIAVAKLFSSDATGRCLVSDTAVRFAVAMGQRVALDGYRQVVDHDGPPTAVSWFDGHGRFRSQAGPLLAFGAQVLAWDDHGLPRSLLHGTEFTTITWIEELDNDGLVAFVDAKRGLGIAHQDIRWLWPRESHWNLNACAIPAGAIHADAATWPLAIAADAGEASQIIVADLRRLLAGDTIDEAFRATTVPTLRGVHWLGWSGSGQTLAAMDGSGGLHLVGSRNLHRHGTRIASLATVGWRPAHDELVSIVTDGWRITSSRVTSRWAPWASATGEDQYGCWADLTVADQIQRFRFIPAGNFLMGSPLNEEVRFVDETQHQVVISQPFWLGDSPVTQGVWHAVMGDNPSTFKGATLPVETVSWEDCGKFLTMINSRLLDLRAKLPTEAQWEYACRAGTLGPFAGTTINALGWYSGNSGQKTHEVKSKNANAWGLFDMHGNVWEWCNDWHGAFPGGLEIDPKGPSGGSLRVDRGGSWDNGPWHSRSAARSARRPDFRKNTVGFRLALSIASGSST